MKLKLASLLLLGIGLAMAQVPPECDPSQQVATGNRTPPCQVVNNYNGSNQLTSSCFALSVESNVRPRTLVSISLATQTSPVVFTSTGHGLPLGTRPHVTVSGGTGNWTIVNVTATATVIDANTFSIPVDTSTAGSPTGTLKFSTTAPWLTVAEWAIKLFTWDGSGNLINSAWLNGSSALTNTCSGSGLTTGNSQ